ncbi:MAG: TIR domain-containing protein [Cyclobacteriaceae bacterium]
MARNIFISYKYKDTLVADLGKKDITLDGGQLKLISRKTRVRDYVDELQKNLKDDDHINLGEKDGESLEEFADSTIETKLKDKIRQSSITIVLISKGMKEDGIPEKDQWIPWEISYSLRTTTVQNRKSQKNAVLGVVLPDENGTYDWYYTENPKCNSTTHKRHQLFEMLSANMFNRKKSDTRECNGTTIHEGEFSYIKTVKWLEFKANSNWYLEKAIEIRDKADEYTLKIQLD